MKVIMVFFVLLICLGCGKDDCYDCTQNVKIYTNKIIKGYPKNYKSKFVSCGENIYLVDNPEPITYSDTLGDTIYTYWRDTECLVK